MNYDRAMPISVFLDTESTQSATLYAVHNPIDRVVDRVNFFARADSGAPPDFGDWVDDSLSVEMQCLSD